MELASVTRLYKDEETHKSTLLMEAVGTKERFKISLPGHKAGILALEGHGLNDRCALYGILSECVDRLGGSFASVKVTLDKTRGVSGSISLSRDEGLTWITADVVELVAFALHVQIPIFLDVTDKPSRDKNSACGKQVGKKGPDLPAVFENVLTEIMGSEGQPDHESPPDLDSGSPTG